MLKKFSMTFMLMIIFASVSASFMGLKLYATISNADIVAINVDTTIANGDMIVRFAEGFNFTISPAPSYFAVESIEYFYVTVATVNGGIPRVDNVRINANVSSGTIIAVNETLDFIHSPTVASETTGFAHGLLQNRFTLNNGRYTLQLYGSNVYSLQAINIWINFDTIDDLTATEPTPPPTPTSSSHIELLNNVTDTSSAVSAVREAINHMTSTQLASGQLELFAELAIARVAQIQVGSNIVISQPTVAQAGTLAQQTQSAIEEMLQQYNYQLLRHLRPTVTFVTEDSDVSIVIDPTALDTDIVQFTVQTPRYSITFSDTFIENEADRAPITVNMQAGNYYEVTFSRPITQPARIALSSAQESDYMAIRRRSTGQFVGGNRNPITGLYEAMITESDTYVVVENRVDFTDIQHLSHEAQRAIRILASHGQVSGVGEGRFNPDAPINRAEIARLVTNMLGLYNPNQNGGFIDVQRADWFFGAAGSANHHNIMHGTGGNMFSPRMVLPRDQLLVLSARVLRNQMGYRIPANPNNVLQIFTDRNDFADWSINDLALATRANLVIRRADGRFMPRDSMTRGDAALVLYRLYMRLW